MIASDVIDLPQPDSPTMHSVSPRRDLEGQVAHRMQRAARRGDVDVEAVDLEQRRRCERSCVTSALRREHVAQAVAAQVDREDQQRQAVPGMAISQKEKNM